MRLAFYVFFFLFFLSLIIYIYYCNRYRVISMARTRTDHVKGIRIELRSNIIIISVCPSGGFFPPFYDYRFLATFLRIAIVNICRNTPRAPRDGSDLIGPPWPAHASPGPGRLSVDIRNYRFTRALTTFWLLRSRHDTSPRKSLRCFVNYLGTFVQYYIVFEFLLEIRSTYIVVVVTRRGEGQTVAGNND